MYENVARSYQQSSFFTANPLKLVIMCYEGAILNLKQAHESYLAKDYESKGRALQKTIDIIHELNATLDMEKGGEIAVTLRSVYTYMTQALIEADLKRDLTIFEKVIGMLEELESSWKQIAGDAERNVDVRPMSTPTGILAGRNTSRNTLSRTWSA